MNNKYLIVGLIVIAAIGFYIWYQSKNQTGASQTLASAPSGGGGSTIINTGGQSVPLNGAGQLLSGLTDALKGFLGGKSSGATTTSPNPVSNVIQTPPFSNPIAAPSDKSSNPVVNPVVIPSPPVSTMPVDNTITVPKTDFSAPIGPAKFHTSLVPNTGVSIQPVSNINPAIKVVNTNPPPSNTVSRPLVPLVHTGNSVLDAVQNAAISKLNAAILAGNYEKSMFESL